MAAAAVVKIEVTSDRVWEQENEQEVTNVQNIENGTISPSSLSSARWLMCLHSTKKKKKKQQILTMSNSTIRAFLRIRYID